MNPVRIANQAPEQLITPLRGNNLLGLLFVSLILVGCNSWLYQSTTYRDGAGVPVDTSLIPDAIPIDEPITKSGNTSPYQQFGETYQVLSSSRGYRETGVASWYGSKFHGRKTANGDIYDMYAMTAAHRTLPIPTYLKVTNLDNQNSVIVRVNDRGPFHKERLIDLSYVAALKLGFAEQGTTNVSVQAIDPSSNTQNNSQQALQKTYLQVGSFKNQQSAISLAATLSNSLGMHLTIKDINHSFKVLLGPIENDRELLRLKQTLKQKSDISVFTLRL